VCSEQECLILYCISCPCTCQKGECGWGGGFIAALILTSELDGVQCHYLLQQQICNLNCFMSLVPNTIGPQGIFHVNLIQLTQLHRHLSLSPTFLSIHDACLVYAAQAHTVVPPVRLGHTQFRHLFCDVLYLCSVLMTATCAPAHFSPHIDASKISLHPFHLSVLAEISIYCQLHISGHRCNCKLFVDFVQMIQIVLASGSLSIPFWVLCEHYESHISHNLFHDTIWYVKFSASIKAPELSRLQIARKVNNS
jgi:hypothetical protein